MTPASGLAGIAFVGLYCLAGKRTLTGISSDD